METNPSYAQIANSWDLWVEYVDPAGIMTEGEFTSMTVEEKIDTQVECFGEEVCCPECERPLPEESAQVGKCPDCTASDHRD